MEVVPTARALTEADGRATDHDDLDALRSRSPDAVARLVRRTEPAVRRLVSRILAWSDETPDVVQDIYATAIVNLPGFRGGSAIETWLMRIAINRCRRHLRRRRFVDWVRRPRPPSPAADEPVDRSETNLAVRNAVAALPARYREVVVLRYLEERSTRETAEILGERVNTVEVRLHRARGMLESALEHLAHD